MTLNNSENDFNSIAAPEDDQIFKDNFLNTLRRSLRMKNQCKSFMEKLETPIIQHIMLDKLVKALKLNQLNIESEILYDILWGIINAECLSYQQVNNMFNIVNDKPADNLENNPFLFNLLKQCVEDYLAPIYIKPTIPNENLFKFMHLNYPSLLFNPLESLTLIEQPQEINIPVAKSFQETYDKSKQEIHKKILNLYKSTLEPKSNLVSSFVDFYNQLNMIIPRENKIENNAENKINNIITSIITVITENISQLKIEIQRKLSDKLILSLSKITVKYGEDKYFKYSENIHIKLGEDNISQLCNHINDMIENYVNGLEDAFEKPKTFTDYVDYILIIKPVKDILFKGPKSIGNFTEHEKKLLESYKEYIEYKSTAEQDYAKQIFDASKNLFGDEFISQACTDTFENEFLSLANMNIFDSVTLTPQDMQNDFKTILGEMFFDIM